MASPEKIEARRLLMRSADLCIRHKGWSRYEWETDMEVMAYAETHGLEKELEHMSKLAFDGFRGR
jgi:hypothetical protein